LPSFASSASQRENPDAGRNADETVDPKIRHPGEIANGFQLEHRVIGDAWAVRTLHAERFGTIILMGGSLAMRPFLNTFS
jgi:hypothetical protein